MALCEFKDTLASIGSSRTARTTERTPDSKMVLHIKYSKRNNFRIIYTEIIFGFQIIVAVYL